VDWFQLFDIIMTTYHDTQSLGLGIYIGTMRDYWSLYLNRAN